MKCLIFQPPFFPKKKHIAPGHLLAFLQHIAAQFLKKSHPTSGAKVKNLLSASKAWRGSSAKAPGYPYQPPDPKKWTNYHLQKREQISKLGTACLRTSNQPNFFRRIICYFSGDEYSTVIFFSWIQGVDLTSSSASPKVRSYQKSNGKNCEKPKEFSTKIHIHPKMLHPF